VGPTSDPVAHLALVLGLLLIAARFGGEVATRIGMPQVLGELIAGVLLRAVPIPIVRALATDPTIDMLARLGALVLLFDVGLALRVRDVLRVGAAASRVALYGSAASFALGYGLVLVLLPDAAPSTRLFLAGSLSATSIGISARVLQDIDQTRTLEARTVLGAAVIDDVIGLIILSLVTGWASSRVPAANRGRALVFLVLKTVGFFGCAVLLGPSIVPRALRAVALLRTRSALVVVGLTFCFLLAWAADAIGLAPIVGAFTAGLVLEEVHWREFTERGERGLDHEIEPLNAFLVPLFFALLGVRTDLGVLTDLGALALALGLTVAAILGKLVSGLGAARGSNRLAVAFGMMPRGEVTLVFASLGLSLASDGGTVLDHRAYSALVVVVVLTTLATPLGLKWSFLRRDPHPPSSQSGAPRERRSEPSA
jgi:Kef-type K+ transport system membrane component KefB